MQAGERLSLEQIRAFLAASDEMQFEGRNREEVYGWVEQTLAAAGLPGTATSRARIGAALPGEDDRAEPGAGDAADQPVPARREEVKPTAVSPAPVPDAVHAGRHRVAGQSGRGARNPERAGHAEAAAAGVLRLRGCSAMRGWRDFRWRTCTGCGESRIYRQRRVRLPADAADGRWPSASGGGRSRRAGPATCAWTRCIRAIWTGTRGCITSTPWTR